GRSQKPSGGSQRIIDKNTNPALSCLVIVARTSSGRPGHSFSRIVMQIWRCLGSSPPILLDNSGETGGPGPDAIPPSSVDAAISPIMKLVNRTGSEYLPTALV